MNIFTVLLTQPLANGLIFFYNLLGSNLGLAIIAFSLFLRWVLNPLTKPYMESMKKMKDFAPQLDKLKKKHKGDKVKFAQAQADFYKEKGVNPGAGCLPYLLQIVVLIAFFNVFTVTLSNGGDPTENFNKLLYEPLKFIQGQTLNTNFLYLDITKPDTLNITGVPFALPGPILFLAALVQLISARVMAPYTRAEEKAAEKTKETSDDFQVMMQKSMSFTFPLFTLLIGLNFPSGLALYWLVFSASQAYQQIKMQGWGGLTPWLERLNLLKSGS
jgi:YidC/Oxa1 family membrane protein insertase